MFYMSQDVLIAFFDVVVPGVRNERSDRIPLYTLSTTETDTYTGLVLE